MSDASWTIGRLLTWTTDYLKQHGSETPRLDAEVLLAFCKRCQRIDLYTSFGDEATEQVRTHFRELIRQRAEGIPVAYLVGHREFYSLDFQVNRDVLIPRPETETLVVELLDRLKSRTDSAPAQIADVGTGSGIIAVCAAKHANCEVLAIDQSAAALEVARANAAKHQVETKIELLQSDLFAAVPTERRFDLVVSNPPYVTIAEMGQLSKEVRREPATALEAGADGLAVISRLIPQAAERLVAGGWLMIELSPMIEAAARQLFDGPTWNLLATVKDMAGRPRLLVAQRAEV